MSLTVTAVVTTHDNPEGLHAMLSQLHNQTRLPDEIRVYASDTEPHELQYLLADAVSVEPNLNDWGHAKRRKGLAECSGDYVGFFNDDDHYDPTYLERLMAHAGPDLIYSDWHTKDNRVFHAEPKLGSITSGCFLVRACFAREVGYLHDRYEADGLFIDDLVAAGASMVRVREALYWHR